MNLGCRQFFFLSPTPVSRSDSCFLRQISSGRFTDHPRYKRRPNKLARMCTGRLTSPRQSLTSAAVFYRRQPPTCLSPRTRSHCAGAVYADANAHCASNHCLRVVRSAPAARQGRQRHQRPKPWCLLPPTQPLPCAPCCHGPPRAR
jgi:hypothetical protein